MINIGRDVDIQVPSGKGGGAAVLAVVLHPTVRREIASYPKRGAAADV